MSTSRRFPDDPRAWSVKVRGADALAASLREHRDELSCFAGSRPCALTCRW